MKPLLILAILSIGSLAPAWAQQSAEAAETAAQTTSNAPAISVIEVRQRTLQDRIIASGLIGPVERVFVQPEIEGQAIDSVLAEIGDTVEEGQVLATLNDTTLNLQETQFVASKASAEAAIAQAAAQLVEAEAAADEAVRVRDRTEALRAQGTVSQAAADQTSASATSALARVTVARQGMAAAEAQLALVNAQIEDAKLRLSRTQIKAPVAGEITARSARIGAIASAAGEPMFVIVREGLLELVADVAEQDVLRLANGQSVTLRLVGLETPLTGTVRLVEPTVDAATRLGKARIELDDSTRVREGLFAEAEILVTERETLSIPVTALSSANSETTVLRVDTNGLVERVSVITGIRDGGYVEITEGLDESDMIVARAGAFVRAGDTVNPVLTE